MACVCPICLDKIRSDVKYTCACKNHHFHRDCINTWFNNVSNKCPMCKTVEPNVMPKQTVSIIMTFDIGYNLTEKNIHDTLMEHHTLNEFNIVNGITFVFEKFGKKLIEIDGNTANITFRDLKMKKTSVEIFDVTKALERK